jgi:hypothetical protein
LVELTDLTRATGLLHPIIHLGFGIEFNQPAIVAQGLAEAACHELWIEAFLLGAEKAAGGIGSSAGKPLAQLIDEARQDKTLAESAHWSDANKIKDGTFIRAFKEMCNHASQYTVSADHLEEQVAEMINANGNLICSLIQNWHSRKLLLQHILPRHPSTLREPSNSIFFSSIASTVQSSTPPSSPFRGSALVPRSAFSNGKGALICSCMSLDAFPNRI